MSKIAQSLEKLYTKHRIVLWYDADKNFEEDLATLNFPEITILTVANDEVAIKHRMLLQEPKQQFLLYMPYQKPSDDENWLKDIELSQTIFHTDQESMLLQELELPFHLQSWLKKQTLFFKSKERLAKFQTLISPKDDVKTLNNKLLQVLLNSEYHDLDQLLRDYVKAFADGKSNAVKEMLEKHHLAEYFWGEIANVYGITNESHNIYDFLLVLFQRSFVPICGAEQFLNSAKVALSNWKDLRSFSAVFDAVSNKIAKDLNVKLVLNGIVLEEVLEEDLFEEIEKSIVKDVIKKVRDRTFNSSRVEEIIKKRESKHWFGKYKFYYQAILKAILLIEEIQKTDFTEIKDLESGFELYSSSYYKVDQWYRQFISLLRRVEASSILHPLYQEVEKIYSNKWLLDLADHWQAFVDKNDKWYFGSKSQLNFYDTVVKSKYIDQKRKVFVIISDALRYEIGEELNRTINLQNRFESKLDYRITGLPSYTQLGMASLLPHSTISLGEADDIFLDGLSTKGMLARAKILNQSGNIKSACISAEELASFKVKSEEAKDLVQNNDVVYVYHNIIDKTGDDKISEEKVFDAVSDELEHLVLLIKKISSNNILHMVITADHGFIYQNEAIAESDFADADVKGSIAKSNRRFVIGKDLSHNEAVLKYEARNLEIDSDTEILIPKGMNRLRRQGAGSRFIHGGSMLQEVVVPVLIITKKREDTISKIEVDIINKSNNKITTNIHPVKFYQSEPTAERLVGRKVKSYFAVDQEGQRNTISDVFVHNFDSAANRAEDRELMYQFKISTLLTRHSEVYLHLEEQIEGSTQWIEYAKYKFTLTLGMMNDFDDF